MSCAHATAVHVWVILKLALEASCWLLLLLLLVAGLWQLARDLTRSSSSSSGGSSFCEGAAMHSDTPAAKLLCTCVCP
jgi:hypothetical protein